MFKFNLNPKSGLLEQTKKVFFELSGLENKNGLRVWFDNATHGTKAKILNLGPREEYIEIPHGITYLKGNLDLNVPDGSSQAAISVFATIQDLGSPQNLIAMLSAVYGVTDKPDEGFDGEVSITPSFIGPKDRAIIRVKHTPLSRVVLSINDRRFIVLINESGEGTIAVHGEDVMTKTKTSVLQKFLVNVFTAATNYTKSLFSGAYLHLMPSKIAMFAADPCNNGDGPNDPPSSGSGDPITNINSYADLNFLSEKRSVDVMAGGGGAGIGGLVGTATSLYVSSLKPLTVFDQAVVQTPYGAAINAFVGTNAGGAASTTSVDLSQSDDPSGVSPIRTINKPRVYLAATKTALDKAPTSELRYGIIAAGEGNIMLYVEQEVYDLADISSYVALFHPMLKSQFYQILDKLPADEYVDRPRLVLEASIAVADYIYCVPYFVIGLSDTPSTAITMNSPQALAVITDVLGLEATPVSVTVAVSKTKLYLTGYSYIYVVCEAVSSGQSQLYLYCTTTQIGEPTFGWKQLTFTGENKNPKAVCDGSGNLHIFWESTRSGTSQIYYGAFGPCAFSHVNAALSASLDKQIELFGRDVKPFSYTQKSLISENRTPAIVMPVRGCDSEAANTQWVAIDSNNGNTTVTDDNHIRIQGNPAIDQSMAWTYIDRDENDTLFTSSWNQRCFGIEFTIHTTNAETVLTDVDIANQYKIWQSSYTPSILSKYKNATVYVKSGNRFVLDKVDRYYDRIIPIIGSYRNPDLEGMYASCSMTAEQDFKAILSGDTSTVRHFMLALMPEKVRFKATNLESLVEYCDRVGGSLEACQASYVVNNESVVYTGWYKLAVILSTDNKFIGNSGTPPFSIIRQVSQPFMLNGNGVTFNIIMHYRAMFEEEAAHWLGDHFSGNYYVVSDSEYVSDYPYNRHLGSLTVSINNEPVFAESFLVDACTPEYNKFDIGFGFPSGGQFITESPQPYETSIYEYRDTDLEIENITIGLPQLIYERTLLDLPEEYRNLSTMNEVGSYSCNLGKYTDTYSWLNLGASTLNFPQIPLTFEGQNQSVDVDLGVFCNDVHAVWQSNRNLFWDIYYTMAIPPTLPYRFETRITSTESNSLMPQVSVNPDGVRVAVWHENKQNNQYQIYAARASGDLSLCSWADCEQYQRGTADSECVIKFEPCYNPCRNYSTGNVTTPKIVTV